jgi:hypothetical protein
MEGKVALIIDGEKSKVTTTPVLEDDQEHKVFIHHQFLLMLMEKVNLRIPYH